MRNRWIGMSKTVIHNTLFIELCDARNRQTAIGVANGRPPKPERMTEMYLASLIQGFAAWRRYRIAVRQLAELDDRTLRDLGVNRSQIREVAWNGR